MKNISCGWLKKTAATSIERQQKGNIVEMRWISLLFSLERRFYSTGRERKIIFMFLKDERKRVKDTRKSRKYFNLAFKNIKHTQTLSSKISKTSMSCEILCTKLSLKLSH